MVVAVPLPKAEAQEKMAMSLTASGVEAAMEATAVPRVVPLAESRRTQLIVAATSIVRKRLLRTCEKRQWGVIVTHEVRAMSSGAV